MVPGLLDGRVCGLRRQQTVRCSHQAARISSVATSPLARSSGLVEVTRGSIRTHHHHHHHPSPMVVAPPMEAIRSLGMMMVLRPLMVVVMRNCLSNSSSPPVWCRHPPSRVVWVSTPPLSHTPSVCYATLADLLNRKTSSYDRQYRHAYCLRIGWLDYF